MADCSAENCQRDAVLRGMCRSHYQMAWKRSKDQWRAEPKVNSGRECSVDGCEKPARQRTYCHMHYQRWRIHGDVNRGRVVEPSCVKCGAEKYRNASGKLYCKPCADAAGVEYRARNRDRLRLASKAKYLRTREAHNARARAYYQANRAAVAEITKRWQAANPDRVLGYKRNWYLKHPEKGAEYAAKRRALKAAAVCEHGPDCVTAEVFIAIREQKCVYCGANAEHADHIEPISRGGLHCRDNLAPACRTCNLSKNNRPVDEWLERRCG